MTMTKGRVIGIFGTLLAVGGMIANAVSEDEKMKETVKKEVNEAFEKCNKNEEES